MATHEPKSFELDHVFIWTAAGAPEADLLRDFGLTEGHPNVHPGQGTANRRFFFHNAMIELLWVHDPEQAQSGHTRPTHLWERWCGRSRDASPFGICLRPQHPEMAAVDGGVQLLPMTAGSIVLAYNLPDGPKDLKLSREAYTKIFLGQVTKWNDPVIAQANPDAKMPETGITVVRRDIRVYEAFRYHQRGVEEWSRDRHDGELAEQR